MSIQRTILLVDDDPVTRRLLNVFLKPLAVRTAEAASGEQALARARVSPPDMVLLDVMMPGMDGYETCRQLRSDPRTRAVPVIFLTNAAEPDQKLQGFAAGATDYIAKPFDRREIIARVSATLRTLDLMQQLERQTREDGLTGLANRGELLTRLRHVLANPGIDGQPAFALLFMDIDRFKVVNDGLGHVAGDSILRLAAGRIRKAVAAMATPLNLPWLAARLGGDEFVVLLEHADEAAVQQVSERIQQVMARPYQLEGCELDLPASVGVVHGGDSYEDAEAVLRDADIAMYRAKASRQRKSVVFDQQMHQEAKDRLLLENDLRRAIDRDQFRLAYQPIHRLGDGTLAGFEALIRWQHHFRGSVRPDQFIPMAEETGLIVSIGQWVLEEAARQLARWRNTWARHTDLFMNVNLSKRQLLSPQFTGTVLNTLDRHGLPPQALTLEVTESVIASDMTTILTQLSNLRAMGVRLAMDDFGTGHSSLVCLHEFPIQVLKIDRAFVASLAVSRNLMAVLQSIVTLAHNLDLQVVAEGLETAEQIAAVQAMECDLGQGYYFARPLTQEDAETLLGQPVRLAQTA